MERVGFVMGVLGEKLSGRDVAIGMMLSLALGLGLLFLHFYTAYASQAAALLFGNVLGVNAAALVTLAGLVTLSLGALAFIGKSWLPPFRMVSCSLVADWLPALPGSAQPRNSTRGEILTDFKRVPPSIQSTVFVIRQRNRPLPIPDSGVYRLSYR